MPAVIEIVKFIIVESLPYLIRWLKSNDANKEFHIKKKKEKEVK